jgi:hypothetical protein
MPAARASAGRSDPPRLLATIGVAAVLGAVVLGGLGLDQAIAAPSAGTVDLGNSITFTADPGWVLVSEEGARTIELRKSDAILDAYTAAGYPGSAANAVDEISRLLEDETVQIQFGSVHEITVSGHDTAEVRFVAIVSTPNGSGTIDGELICMVIDGTAVVFQAYAPQGDLERVSDDISHMIASVEVGL